MSRRDHRSTSIRSIRAVVIVLALLPFASPALAESVMEKTGIGSALGLAPTGADVLTEIHQFDLFERQADDTAQMRGDDGLKQFSIERAGEAKKQDQSLAALKDKAGVKVTFSEEPSVTRSNRLAGLQGSVGPDYVWKYYEAQVAEHDSALSVLRRYLKKPDNDQIKSYAAKQIPALEASQQIAKENWKRTSH